MRTGRKYEKNNHNNRYKKEREKKQQEIKSECHLLCWNKTVKKMRKEKVVQ